MGIKRLCGRTTSGRTKRLSDINRRMTTLLRYSGTGGRRDTLNYIGSNMTVSLPSFGILLDLHQGKTPLRHHGKVWAMESL